MLIKRKSAHNTLNKKNVAKRGTKFGRCHYVIAISLPSATCAVKLTARITTSEASSRKRSIFFGWCAAAQKHSSFVQNSDQLWIPWFRWKLLYTVLFLCGRKCRVAWHWVVHYLTKQNAFTYYICHHSVKNALFFFVCVVDYDLNKKVIHTQTISFIIAQRQM